MKIGTGKISQDFPFYVEYHGQPRAWAAVTKPRFTK